MVFRSVFFVGLGVICNTLYHRLERDSLTKGVCVDVFIFIEKEFNSNRITA